jgi:hypothetical protein
VPVNAVNLNHAENGLAAVTDAVSEMSPTPPDLDQVLPLLDTDGLTIKPNSSVRLIVINGQCRLHYNVLAASCATANVNYPCAVIPSGYEPTGLGCMDDFTSGYAMALRSDDGENPSKFTLGCSKANVPFSHAGDITWSVKKIQSN